MSIHILILIILTTLPPKLSYANPSSTQPIETIWHTNKKIQHLLAKYLQATLAKIILTTPDQHTTQSALQQHIHNEYSRELNTFHDHLDKLFKNNYINNQSIYSLNVDTILTQSTKSLIQESTQQLGKKKTLTRLIELVTEHEIQQQNILRSNNFNLNKFLHNSKSFFPKQKLSNIMNTDTSDQYLTIDQDATVESTNYLTGYGHSLILKYENGKQHIFGKLKQIFVKQGQHVSAGSHIAYSPKSYQKLLLLAEKSKK